MLTAHLIPVFSDNYVFIVVDPSTHEAVVVDPGSAAEVILFLKAHHLKLIAALITHQHSDHIDGLSALCTLNPGLTICAPLKNKSDIPEANGFVSDGDRVKLLGHDWQVIELRGHTQGHVAYYNHAQNWLFSGDVVFGMGGGRLFEGSFEDMWQSFNRIRSLPPETKIFCAHEYTSANYAFSQQVMSSQQDGELLNQEALERYHSLSGLSAPLDARVVDLAPAGHQALMHQTVPLLLQRELAANLFFKARTVDELKMLRLLRNQFRYRET